MPKSNNFFAQMVKENSKADKDKKGSKKVKEGSKADKDKKVTKKVTKKK